MVTELVLLVPSLVEVLMAVAVLLVAVGVFMATGMLAVTLMRGAA